ncbi:MAG: type II toxin-antitoxin system RelE/ParE family toxin [Flavobacteriaceae bacterium]|nr:type II toxin-antitoxin system RelE/ParE family toxin [Flavobacteriaceae bacterium]
MRTVRWNKLARFDYYQNISYLLQNWSEKEAQNFIDKVFEIENMLAKGNVEFQNTDRVGIKRCVINKQISLFYKIHSENKIELLRFWNNNKNLKSLNL